ncbi:MAG: succinyldiaminopimelate transaminase [Micrococcales bacterium]|nr:MAG: succinyldiaminopimelate transaminase [Micrococcales bacterium]PIE26134.1 MAG: succinyldiaminopimelate transaminase [Micrococcales bacterium]
MRPAAARLPQFPWDRLAPYAQRARSHPGGICDLSVGTPVDPTPDVVRRALAAAADAPGYPTTWGTAQLRQAVVDWFGRARGVPGLDPDAVLPTIGSKELVGWLPTLLGLGPGHLVAYPRIAYPTYRVGADLAGADSVAVDALTALGPNRADLLWLNSPANPTGQVLGVEHLCKVVGWARERDVVVASDECYAMLDWRDEAPARGVPSILDPLVTDGDITGLLAVYSLSKQSAMAGYRAAFVVGDPALIDALLQARKHLGMMVPTPVQHAMVAALTDDEHVEQARATYRRRREQLVPAVQEWGLRLEHSEAGLYLWATAGEPGWRTVGRLAELGILVAPGDFYGPAGRDFVRISLTAGDAAIQAVVQRLTTG